MTKSSSARSGMHLWLPALTTAVFSALALALASRPRSLQVLSIALALGLGLVIYRLLAALGRERELEEQRRRSELLEARVAESTAEFEALTKSFSHDLKSPLGAILNFTAILEVDHRERWDADSFDILTRIRRSAMRATAMLEGLNRLSRVSRAPLEPQVLDMDDLARKAFAQARAPDGDADVEFVLDPLPEARGDPALVAEALCHLFENALRYTRGREKRSITVRGTQAGGECAYEIADNGCGFDMRYADRLFGLFERMHRSPEISGSGIGLAIVKKIVQRHGGRVWAEAEVDRGARFLFTLPAGRTPS